MTPLQRPTIDIDHDGNPKSDTRRGRTMATFNRGSATRPLVALTLVMLAAPALAGGTGTEFQSMYATMIDWATGFLGKSIAIAAFILGAGIGVARSSPIPALAGVVFALFMVYVPTIIDSIMTATV